MALQTKRMLLAIGVVVMVVTVGVLVGLYLYLPIYVETRLLPNLARQLGLEPQEIRVGRISLSGADLGPIHLGVGDKPSIGIASIQVDYSFSSLVRRKIQALRISGLEIELVINEKGAFIPGLRLPSSPSSIDEKDKELAGLDIKLPLNLDRLGIGPARVNVHWRNKTLQVPFDVDLNTADLAKGLANGTIRLSPRGNRITITAAVDTGANGAELTLVGDGVQLAHFSDFFTQEPQVHLSGKVDLNCRATCQLVPLQMTALNATALLTQVKMTSPHGTLQNLPTAEGDQPPIQLTVKADEKQHLQWRCAPFGIAGPTAIEVTALEGSVIPSAQGWEAKAMSRTKLPAQNLAVDPKVSIGLQKALVLAWDLSAHYTPNKGLQFNLQAGPDGTGTKDKLVLGAAGLKAHSKVPIIDMSGTFSDQKQAVQYEVAFSDLSLDLPQGKLTCPSWSLTGAATMAPQPSLHTTATLADMRLHLASATVDIPLVTLKTHVLRDAASTWAAATHLELDNGRLIDKQHHLRVRGLSSRVDLQWPVSMKRAAGNFAAATIQWKSHQLGTLRGALHQLPKGLLVKARHPSKLFPGLNVYIQAEADEKGATLAVHTPPYEPKEDVDLGMLVPSATGIKANGRLEARAELAFKGPTPQGSAHVKIDHGRLSLESRKLNVSGITLDLRIDDLLDLRTEPRQTLYVETMQMDPLIAKALAIDFQIESPASIFVENAGLKWCQGTINAKDFRVKPGADKYELTLICDRLNLAMLLEQLQAAKASGEGTVSGDIPIRWQKGSLSFHNGALSSPKGETSTIKITNTQYLLAGLPPDTPQYTELDIATEALKDYTYKWARLSLNSEKEILLLALQLDGKPNRLLPFSFDPKLGQLKRVEGEGQADFKGIRIDLNFRSPINELLHYKELLTPKLK